MSDVLSLFEMPPEIPGAAELAAHYGTTRHTFHDGEIQSISLNAKGASELRILTWEMTREVDSQGYGVLANKAIVTFEMTGVSDCELNGFMDGQNVVGSLRIERVDTGYRLIFESTVGVGGYIEFANAKIAVEPIDSDS